ncbi:unnamed protein product [Fusarium graminearum]|nr:unnamed protein product [Fusarium graminearum]
MDRFREIEQHYNDKGLLCRICGARIIGGQKKLKIHQQTHTGLPAPELVNGRATWNSNTAANLQTKTRPEEDKTAPATIDQVHQFLKSTPSKVRYEGGKFKVGSLAGQTVTGMPGYFDSSGRLKEKYN